MPNSIPLQPTMEAMCPDCGGTMIKEVLFDINMEPMWAWVCQNCSNDPFPEVW
jgi:hypothetical protein